MNLAQELKGIADISNEPYRSEATVSETRSAYTYLSTRFRSMSYHGHTNAAFKLSESLWFIDDLKAAVSMLENDGFVVEWNPNGLDDVLAVYWS